MKVFLATLLLITLHHSCAVSPTNCSETEPVAGKVLDLINKGRQDGYLFQLLRVADAHLDKAESATVYYLVLDVVESDCSVLSRKHWNDCELADSRRPSEIVIGQCKVVATAFSHESLDLRVNNFNCTTSSVSSALSNTKDSPVLFDFFEDTEPYRKQANKALEKHKTENSDFTSFRVDQVERVIRVRGGKGTGYYVDFSIRNCSRHHSHRHSNVFGFCRADFFYDVEASDLETPKDLVVNCDVFNLEEHRNFHGEQHHLGIPPDSGSPEHLPAGRRPFKPNGSRGHHHHHKPHGFGCPPPLEDKDHDHNHNQNSSESHPHGHHSHEHHSYRHYGLKHPSRKHHSRRKHPHGDGFHDHSPCDRPSHSQGPHGHHDPPPKHSEEKGLGKRYFPSHWRQIGYVYQLPPLNKEEILSVPEANFPRCSLPNHKNPRMPEIQPFPQSTSESCPGKFKNEFLHILKFFEYTAPK
ncbi:PREDICTED: histidine-rich glycoprotein [Chrysochloris asiatica]|uniref:Histidine-rich glycoprotein n=1 Tax=Chrysochloris asiatica TaxID=185453 RepID=A0A9B0TZJ9_CHRAS|nr:PREDICTED: histidine-rich glycoprotein [Chrysochloris asiatica]